MKKIIQKSSAKINLTLEVVNCLPDGFHTIRSIMFKLQNVYDIVEIFFDDKLQGIEISCQNKSVPCDDKNIIWKITEAFFKKTGKKTGVRIKIRKNIPLCSGMGGGSSNGATVLLALNNYFQKPLALLTLVDLSAKVGKDIPFFLKKGRVAYVQGAGEKITTIKNFPKLNLLIINLEGGISTLWAFNELDKKLFFMNSKKRKNLSLLLSKNRKDIFKIGKYLYNDFSIVAKEKYPIIEVLEKALISFGAVGTSISGKGPTVFGIFKTRQEVEEVGKIFKRNYSDFFISIG